MWKEILNPPAIKDYSDYFKTLLSVSGVLLGLAFTALLFVIQSGFSSFKFSRRMFLELYVLLGRNLIINLSYLTLIPLGILYLPSLPGTLTIGYYLFSLYFIKSYLDLQKHRGYIHTLFSTRFVPASYGKLRAYFRYIRNLGFIPNLVIITYVVIIIGYPIIIASKETGNFFLTNKAFFYSTLILLFFSIVQIVNFIPEFFRNSNEEIESKIDSIDNSSSDKPSEVDYKKEMLVLKDYLIAHGVHELETLNKVPFLSGALLLNFSLDREDPEAWFNINIEAHNNNLLEIREAVINYAFKLFSLLRNSMVDINSFVLSFHIYAGGEKASRNIFFRSSRRELNDILSSDTNPKSAVMKIKNKLFDELYRDLK